ncbi:hypothetical protein B0H19DRAFT_1241023 [Mycena capillaripes]|nr:hypothetical protein B0H19DRAFT_1241023 [Mycena capillaripes]
MTHGFRLTRGHTVKSLALGGRVRRDGSADINVQLEILIPFFGGWVLSQAKSGRKEEESKKDGFMARMDVGVDEQGGMGARHQGKRRRRDGGFSGLKWREARSLMWSTTGVQAECAGSSSGLVAKSLKMYRAGDPSRPRRYHFYAQISQGGDPEKFGVELKRWFVGLDVIAQRMKRFLAEGGYGRV